MSEPAQAVFKTEGSSQEIQVHFNPASLQLTVANKLGPAKSKDKKGGRQVVSEASAKLALELVFDTTGSLDNVCDTTVQVARLMGEKGKPSPQVTFSWGAFRFTGIVDSYKETLEFFSADGVPLRASVSLGMTREEDVFERGPSGRKAAGWSGDAEEPAEVSPAPGSSTTETATQGGQPAAGRALAESNGLNNMRFPDSPSLVVNASASASLSPPVAFASGSASASLGGSSVGFASGSASAGLDAFSGLRTPSFSASGAAQLDTRRLVPRVETSAHATSGSSFELGGRVLSRGGRLGAGARGRIRFEQE
jgi:hypothetical protein